MRKQILFFIFFVTVSTFGQDLIIKHNGDEITAKVLEISIIAIKYKDYDFQQGPVRNILIADVFMIIYENGTREVFPIKETKAKVKEYKGKYIMIGLGGGLSYGGLGIRFQQRFGGQRGFAYHAGIGYFMAADAVHGSIGLKFFPYKDLYINAQFGYTGFDDYYQHRFSNRTGSLVGTSLLIGGDWNWNWGSKVGIGFNWGIGGTFNFNYYHYSNEFKPAFDIGFIVRF